MRKLVFGFLLLLITVFQPLMAADMLRVLAWPGYADPDAVKQFEKQMGVRVEVTQVDSDDVLWQLISDDKSPGFDVFAVNTAELARYISAGLASPIDRSQIPNSRLQIPRFRDMNTAVPGIVKNRLIYGIPYTYADMGLIYDKRTFPKPPTSISVLWDPQFSGRVLAYDGGVHNFSLAALKNGSRNPFKINEKDWDSLAADLIALRRNVLGFYSQPEEALKLYREHKAVLLFANYGSQQLQTFKAAGLDVGYIVPKEGALA